MEWSDSTKDTTEKVVEEYTKWYNDRFVTSAAATKKTTKNVPIDCLTIYKFVVDKVKKSYEAFCAGKGHSTCLLALRCKHLASLRREQLSRRGFKFNQIEYNKLLFRVGATARHNKIPMEAHDVLVLYRSDLSYILSRGPRESPYFPQFNLAIALGSTGVRIGSVGELQPRHIVSVARVRNKHSPNFGLLEVKLVIPKRKDQGEMDESVVKCYIGNLSDVDEDPLHSPCIVAGLDMIVREQFGVNLEEFWRRRTELLGRDGVGTAFFCPLARGFSLQPRLREWAAIAGYDTDFYICMHSSIRRGFAESASANIAAAGKKSGISGSSSLHDFGNWAHGSRVPDEVYGAHRGRSQAFYHDRVADDLLDASGDSAIRRVSDLFDADLSREQMRVQIIRHNHPELKFSKGLPEEPVPCLRSETPTFVFRYVGVYQARPGMKAKYEEAGSCTRGADLCCALYVSANVYLGGNLYYHGPSHSRIEPAMDVVCRALSTMTRYQQKEYVKCKVVPLLRPGKTCDYGSVIDTLPLSADQKKQLEANTKALKKSEKAFKLPSQAEVKTAAQWLSKASLEDLNKFISTKDSVLPTHRSLSRTNLVEAKLNVPLNTLDNLEGSVQRTNVRRLQNIIAKEFNFTLSVQLSASEIRKYEAAVKARPKGSRGTGSAGAFSEQENEAVETFCKSFPHLDRLREKATLILLKVPLLRESGRGNKAILNKLGNAAVALRHRDVEKAILAREKKAFDLKASSLSLTDRGRRRAVEEGDAVNLSRPSTSTQTRRAHIYADVPSETEEDAVPDAGANDQVAAAGNEAANEENMQNDADHSDKEVEEACKYLYSEEGAETFVPVEDYDGRVAGVAVCCRRFQQMQVTIEFHNVDTQFMYAEGISLGVDGDDVSVRLFQGSVVSFPKSCVFLNRDIIRANDVLKFLDDLGAAAVVQEEEQDGSVTASASSVFKIFVGSDGDGNEDKDASDSSSSEKEGPPPKRDTIKAARRSTTKDSEDESVNSKCPESESESESESEAAVTAKACEWDSDANEYSSSSSEDDGDDGSDDDAASMNTYNSDAFDETEIVEEVPVWRRAPKRGPPLATQPRRQRQRLRNAGADGGDGDDGDDDVVNGNVGSDEDSDADDGWGLVDLNAKFENTIAANGGLPEAPPARPVQAAAADAPVFTGAWYHQNFRYGQETLSWQTLLEMQGRPNEHWLHQADGLGRGFAVDVTNPLYHDNNLYSREMVRNFQQVGHPVWVSEGVVYQSSCVACGYRIINARRPHERVLMCYLEGDAGEPCGATKKNLIHYCCGHAGGNLRYDFTRFQAVLCLQGRQKWGVSHNSRDTGSDLGNPIPIRWTITECIDLILGVKFSCVGHEHQALQREGHNGFAIDWDDVLSHCPILRCTGKTANDLRAKWYGRGSIRIKSQSVFAPGFSFV